MSAANEPEDLADISYANSKPDATEDAEEVFQNAEYRALGWFVHFVAFRNTLNSLINPRLYCRVRTTVILMKLCFATGVLAIPSAFSIVGYGPGVLLLASWGALATCTFHIWALRIEPANMMARLCLHYVCFPNATPWGP